MSSQNQSQLIATPQVAEAARIKEASLHILDLAKAKGASTAEVCTDLDAGFSLSVRQQDIETLEHHCDQSLSLTVYIGQAKGTVSITDLSTAALQEAVTYACHLAQYAEQDPFAGLPEPAILAFEYPDLDLYHPYSTDVETAVALAKSMEQAAFDCDPRIRNSEGASLNSISGYRILANSHGFVGEYWHSHHGASVSVIAEADGLMERDYDYANSRSIDIFQNPAHIGRMAAERAVARLHAQKISTRTVPVIYNNRIAISLLGNFFAAIRGSNQYRKSSFLLDSIGKAVLPAHMNIFEYPHLLGASGSAPFDTDGVKTNDRVWVKDGILQGYILDTYAARKLHMPATGNAGGLHNIRLDTSEHDLSGLLKQMHQGVLVTELLGQGVNIVTGDYSRGFAGFWVDDGKIQYPLHEMTLAGNLRDMLQGIVAIGSDLDQHSHIWTGSILIDKMTVAGN